MEKQISKPMDRQKLIYNVLQDVWAFAKEDYSKKPKAEMTSEDWSTLTERTLSLSKKYESLPPEQFSFFYQVIQSVVDLIDREDKYEVMVDCPPEQRAIWLTSEEAQKFGKTVPQK